MPCMHTSCCLMPNSNILRGFSSLFRTSPHTPGGRMKVEYNDSGNLSVVFDLGIKKRCRANRLSMHCIQPHQCALHCQLSLIRSTAHDCMVLPLLQSGTWGCSCVKVRLMAPSAPGFRSITASSTPCNAYCDRWHTIPTAIQLRVGRRKGVDQLTDSARGWCAAHPA